MITLVLAKDVRDRNAHLSVYPFLYFVALGLKGQIHPFTPVDGCNGCISSSIQLSDTGRPVVWLSDRIRQDGLY